MRILTSLAVAGVLLSGCAFQKQVHNIAIDYNEAVASTSNELTFLNIVRAREQHPLHFTTISAMRGGVSMTLGSELGIGIKGEALTSDFDRDGVLTGTQTGRGVETPTPKVSGSFTTGPSFDVGILNTQDFQRGILSPVPAKVVGHFLEQGWPPEYLTALFVERVEFVLSKDQHGKQKGDIVRTLVNDPDEPEGEQFSAFLKCYVLGAASTPRETTPLVDYADVKTGSTLADVATLDGSKFDLAKVTPEGEAERPMVVRVTPASPALKLQRLGDNAEAECTIRSTTRASKSSGRPIEGLSVTSLRPGKGSQPRQEPEAASVSLLEGGARIAVGGTTYDVDSRVLIRSPSAIIYFLGEYARARQPYTVDNGKALIVVREGSSRDAFVRTTLRGKAFYLPDKDNGRSLQTLSIVQQIVNLHKNSSDLPSTGAVQIVR